RLHALVADGRELAQLVGHAPQLPAHAIGTGLAGVLAAQRLGCLADADAAHRVQRVEHLPGAAADHLCLTAQCRSLLHFAPQHSSRRRGVQRRCTDFPEALERSARRRVCPASVTSEILMEITMKTSIAVLAGCLIAFTTPGLAQSGSAEAAFIDTQ